MISQSTIERVKEIPILDVVQKYHDVKKNGTTWRGKSPWTDEKTGSFYVVPSKNIFKDFSSGRGGSSIKFVMELKSIGFPDAIKELAGQFNIRMEYDEVTEDRKAEADKKEILYKLNAATARKYHEQLIGLEDPQHPAQTEVISKRQFTDETILQWEIGYAPGATGNFNPEGWKFLVHLVGDKSREAALELGLIHEKNHHTYDTFRHRVMYPIHDLNGRVVGFGGRALAQDEFNAKYINSPESPVYRKETVLFGLHFAQDAIRKCGYAYLTEGYTDVISLHQASFNCAVGTCGTALTDAQCKLLRKYCAKVVLFRDGDEAGKKATLRDIDILTAHGFEIGVVPMPEFEDGRKVDPDELVRMF